MLLLLFAGQISNNDTITYQTVNHCKNCVDPITKVHTQAIESYWAKTKYRFKIMKGVRYDKLPGYLDERMWRDRYANTMEDSYNNIINHISEIYIFNMPSTVPSLTHSPTPSPIPSPIPTPPPAPILNSDDDIIFSKKDFNKALEQGKHKLNRDAVNYDIIIKMFNTIL